MSASDTETESAEISSATEISSDKESSAKRTGKKVAAATRGTTTQKSIYDKRTVCLDNLLKPGKNKAFANLYNKELETGKEYFAVCMFQHGCDEDAQTCSRPNAVWSVLNSRTTHYNDFHQAQKPEPKEGLIWACLVKDQLRSNVIRFYEGQTAPDVNTIKLTLGVPEAQSQPSTSGRTPESEVAQQQDAQPAAEPHTGFEQGVPHTESEESLLDEFGEGLQDAGDDRPSNATIPVSPMEQDPLMDEDDADVIRSFEIAFRRHRYREENARKSVEYVSKKRQKLQHDHEERQRLTDQKKMDIEQLHGEIQETNRQILRLQEEVRVKKDKVSLLQSVSVDHTEFENEMNDIQAQQQQAELNHQRQVTKLQEWSDFNDRFQDMLKS